MAKYDLALKKLQNERLEASSKLEDVDKYASDGLLGYLSGLERAEAILFDLQKQNEDSTKALWYRGCPNDIKPNNRGTYVVIMKAHFDSDDGIQKGNVYIDTDFWDGENWESFEIGESTWEVLYFTKLEWLRFPLPEDLGFKRSDKMFFN